MKSAVPLFLEDDTVVHLDLLAGAMSQRFNRTVSRSEAVEWLVMRHWKKMQVAKTKAAAASLVLS